MNNTRDGFTTLEVLVATVIISLSCALIFGASTAIISSSKKINSTCTMISSLYVSDQILRNLIGQIRIPFWERRLTLGDDATTIEIPWYEGIPEQNLRLSINQKTLLLSVKAHDTTRSYLMLKNVDDITIRTLVSAEKIPVGIEIAYTSNKITYHTIACFGTNFSRSGK